MREETKSARQRKEWWLRRSVIASDLGADHSADKNESGTRFEDGHMLFKSPAPVPLECQTNPNSISSSASNSVLTDTIVSSSAFSSSMTSTISVNVIVPSIAEMPSEKIISPPYADCASNRSRVPLKSSQGNCKGCNHLRTQIRRKDAQIQDIKKKLRRAYLYKAHASNRRKTFMKKELLKKHSSATVNFLLGKNPGRWSKEEVVNALLLKSMSTRAYQFLRENKLMPLPGEI
jgi:hypothetical protein